METVVITFSEENMKDITSLHDNKLVITTKIKNFDVYRVLVDS